MNMSIRKVHITREAVDAIAGDGHPLAQTGRVLKHLGESALEMGMKGMAVAEFLESGITVTGDAEKGWSLSAARRYAEGYERTFGHG
jgi:hypothetical protein